MAPRCPWRHPRPPSRCVRRACSAARLRARQAATRYSARATSAVESTQDQPVVAANARDLRAPPPAIPTAEYARRVLADGWHRRVCRVAVAKVAVPHRASSTSTLPPSRRGVLARALAIRCHALFWWHALTFFAENKEVTAREFILCTSQVLGLTLDAAAVRLDRRRRASVANRRTDFGGRPLCRAVGSLDPEMP
jgi:hypothetical protein